MSASAPPQSPTSFAAQAAELHRSQGITANNATWDWLGTPDGERTTDDEEAMTRSAYAAAAVARAAAEVMPIVDDEDRGIVEGDLASEPWFGL